MPQRQKILEFIAETIVSLPTERIQKIAIDGVDGAGKTVFGDDLAVLVESKGRAVIRASVDGFHNCREVRFRLGKGSPEGFYRDSYNYQQLKRVLLDPLSPNGSGNYVSAIFDVDANEAVSNEPGIAQPSSILIFDGIFLHRPELREYWDYSVFLDVGFDVSVPRGAQRGRGSPDPKSPSNVRYIEGQKIYLNEGQPTKHASVVIDYNDLSSPRLMKP